MRYITFASIVVGLMLLSGCEKKKPADNIFSSPDGLFRVYMPGKPHAQKQNFAGGPSTIYTVDHMNRSYAVGVSEIDIPEGESTERIESRLDNLTRDQISSIRGKLTESKRISLGQYPGMDIEAVLPDDEGMLRGRTFIADNRLYRVLCVANDDVAFSAEAERFLSSFQILAPKSE